MKIFVRKNSTLLITFLIMVVFFIIAFKGMGVQDFSITLLRGLSAGSVVFLVAAGFSLIFGLLDVLNLAQGTLYMIGAYIASTVIEASGSFLLGIAGAIFGSWVLRVLGIYTSGGLVPSILVAILGAVLLVVIVRALKRA